MLGVCLVGSMAGRLSGGGCLSVATNQNQSKKIAQLTKVIYLLNTKNDEHEYELKGLEDQYESDIDQVRYTNHTP